MRRVSRFLERMPNIRVFRRLTTQEFIAKQEELRGILRDLTDVSIRSSKAAEYFSVGLSDLERDALWWTCVHDRDLGSFSEAFMKRYEDEDSLVYFGWRDEGAEEAEASASRTAKTVLVLCPDYSHLATMTRGPYSKAGKTPKDAKFHEDRYRWIHEYLCAAKLLPAPFKDDPASVFKQEIFTNLITNDTSLTMEPSNSSTYEVTSALNKLNNNAFVMIAMCGHGAITPASLSTQSSSQSGVALLAGGDRLTEQAIALALRDFKGTLVLAYCMCHAASLAPVPSNSSAGGEVERPSDDCILDVVKDCRRVVKIYTCERSETITPSQATTFSRLLGRMIKDRPVYVDLQAWVDSTWPECRSLNEPPSMWRPAPVVTVQHSPFYREPTARFLD